MRNNTAKSMAFCGVFAALAVVIMSLGGLIPIATYVCPLLCMILGCIVLRICDRRYGWTWYIAVSLLSILLGPDKEAAAVYVFLGYYPLIKGYFDRCRLGVFLKFMYFNVVIILLYGLLIYVLGFSQLYSEFQDAGIVGGVLLLILGNVTFSLTDKVLERLLVKR